MEIDLSIVLLLRDAEQSAAAMVRTAVALASTAGKDLEGSQELSFEVIAVDEQSRDNTLSVLSVLHGQIAQLRTVQGAVPGTALREGARSARGRVWLLIDRPVELELAQWAAREVLCGRRAAIIPGEILCLEAALGKRCLTRVFGGLVAGQRNVREILARSDERPAFSPAPDRGMGPRAHLFLRSYLPRLVAAQLDRPWQRS